LWLVVALDSRHIDLKSLARAIGAARISFGKPELLWEVLGVTPGAVTPFGLINCTTQRVTVVLDAEMMRAERLNYHPLSNDATTAIGPDNLRRFIAACGHVPLDLDFAALEAEATRTSS
jgi:Ala-tRNA(Pro) deacylase